MRNWWLEYREGTAMGVVAAIEAGVFVPVFVLAAIFNGARA